MGLVPGASVVARMPSGNERRAMRLDEGVPVLKVRGPPGDEVELTRPPT